MSDNAELLKTLHRLRNQLCYAITMVESGNLKFDSMIPKTRSLHDFMIGDFEIRDLRVSKVKCDKLCP